MALKWQHRKCMAFLWDEGLTIKQGAGENKNTSGISAQMKRGETCETNGVMALLEWQPSVAQPLGRWCKLQGVSTSPLNHETGPCFALIDRFLATASLFSLRTTAQTRSCYTSSQFLQCTWCGPASTGQMHLCDKHIGLCTGRTSRAIEGLIMIQGSKRKSLTVIQNREKLSICGFKWTGEKFPAQCLRVLERY